MAEVILNNLERMILLNYGGILDSDIDQNGNQTGTTDLIRRRWLDNNFYVLNASAITKQES
jgi:hypothetical protein